MAIPMHPSRNEFRLFYDQYHRKVYAFFLKRMKSEDVATELTQLVFIRIWKTERNYLLETQTGATNARDAFCFTVASSVLIDHIRQQARARRNKMSIMAGDYAAEQQQVDNSNTFESSDLVKTISGDLPPVRRNVLLLKVVQGYSNRQVAEHLSMSVKTVEDHYTKAIRHIRKRSSRLICINLMLTAGVTSFLHRLL